MTLIVGMKAGGVIILGADSRGGNSSGEYIDGQEKLLIYDDFAIGISGKGDVGRSLLRKYDDELRKEYSSIDAVADNMARLFSKFYNESFPWTAMPRDERPGVNFALVGFNKKCEQEYEPVIFILDSSQEFIPVIASDDPAFLGYSDYARYLRKRHWRKDISRDEAELLAFRMIAETRAMNRNVGGRVNIVEIRPCTKPIRLTDDELDVLDSKNNSLNQEIISLLILKANPQFPKPRL